MRLRPADTAAEVSQSTPAQFENLTISNNAISNIKGSGWSSFTSDSIAGILIGNTASTTGGIKLYFNSVNLGSGIFAGNSSGTLSAALAVASSSVTASTFGTTSSRQTSLMAAATAKSYAIYSAAPSSAFRRLTTTTISSAEHRACSDSSLPIARIWPACRAVLGRI